MTAAAPAVERIRARTAPGGKMGGRPALVLPALLALLGGLYAGLLRVGWGLPSLGTSLAAAHGPLMIGGFLGTVIALERAVALAFGQDRGGGAETAAKSGRRASGAVAIGGRAALLGPGLTALGALALLAGAAPWASALITAGSAAFVGASLVILRRQPALHHATLAAGALAWLGGNALWLAGWPVARVVPWWAAFLVLTIVGERLELSRVLMPPPAARAAFAAIVAVLAAGVVLGAARPEAGARVVGLAFVAAAAWLFAYDVTRRTIHATGLTRFIAACMLSGYLWLGVSGVLFAADAGLLAQGGGPAYDAALHAVFLGFVFSMIFGHAPIILPAVTRLAVRYRAAFYGHLGLLHASLALRVAGDLGAWWGLRRWGALLSAAAILLFVVSTATSIRGKEISP